MNHVHFSHERVNWKTPETLYVKLNAEFHFDWDPCPLDGSDDALLPLFVSWRNRRVFCNPPYGPGIDRWLKRGLEAPLAVFLLPARTDTRWFHQIALRWAREIRFLPGRLYFSEQGRAPFPSMLVIFEHDHRSAPVVVADLPASDRGGLT
jgi:site-specific DNA-methyltransferase (adenine-specific)